MANVKIWISPAATYTVDWDYTNTAPEGLMVIYKNGITEVTVSTTDSGFFQITAGDTIDVVVSTSDEINLTTVTSALVVTEGASTIFNDSVTATALAIIEYPPAFGSYAPQDNITISGTSS